MKKARSISNEAFESIADVSLLQRKVLEFVVDRGPHGATCDEVEQDLGLLHQTASARVSELYGKGYLQDSQRTRLTRSGRKAIVWLSVYPKPGDPQQRLLLPREKRR